MLLIDATSPFDKQDVQLADWLSAKAARFIIGINKWDLKLDRQEVRQTVNDTLLRALPKLRGVPVIMLSAETGQGVDQLMPAIIRQYGLWNAASARPSSIIGCRAWLSAILHLPIKGARFAYATSRKPNRDHRLS